jgi:hypothetical protein
LIRRSGRRCKRASTSYADAIARDPKFKSTNSAYDRIKNAQAQMLKMRHSITISNRSDRSRSLSRRESILWKSVQIRAVAVARSGDKREANGNGSRNFRDSARESLELELFSHEPIYDDYEIPAPHRFADDFASQFGAEDPFMEKVLDGKSRTRAL